MKKSSRTGLDVARPRLAVADEVAARTKRAAIDLRRAETESERVLWNALRARHFRGLKFRRQHAIGPFVVDFYCAEQRPVVEIDGSIHDDEAHIVADPSRQQAIESINLRFVRIRSELVLSDLTSALQLIESALRQN